MAPESPSSAWEERVRSHKSRHHSPERNLTRSSSHHEYEDDVRYGELERRAQREDSEDRHQFMDEDYEDESHHHARHSKRNHEGTRTVIGLDLNVGQSSSPEPRPLSSSSKLLHSPNSRHVLPPPLPRWRDRSVSRSPPSAATAGQGRKSSPPSSLPSRRRSTGNKQHSPVSTEPQPGSSPPSKGPRLPSSKRSPPFVGERQQQQQIRYAPSPVRRRDPSVEPVVAGRRSRSVTPLKRRSASGDPALSPFNEERERSVTPLRRRLPSVDLAEPEPASRRRSPRRSLTPPRRRLSSGEPGRKRSASPYRERRRPSAENGTKRKERSRTPLRQRERSRSRSPVPRRSPSLPPQSRRTRSPAGRRRSPRRSPRRERSPVRRASPRRRSSPGRYRGSRRDRRTSPVGHRGWSPVQNRSNGAGKPGNNLFIAGFNFITTEKDLERKFSRYGRVMDVRIVRDKRSGESRGFGFLTLERDEDADAAIKSLDQTEWNGRIVLVEKAKTPTRF